MDILSATSSQASFDPDLAVSAVTNAFNLLMLASSYVNATWPENSPVKDGDSFDFIVVGCGTAGAVLCSRLAEVPEWRVLCVEAGGDPTLTSVIPAVWPILTHGPLDWDYYSAVDPAASQALRGGRTAHTRGKVLGGTSAIGHLIATRGLKSDYEEWAKEAHGWDHDSVMKYLLKAEKMLDEKILSGPTSNIHNSKGAVCLKPQIINELLKEKNTVMVKAYEEIGMNILHDPLIPYPNGTSEAYFFVTDKESRRASTAEEYLLPCKNRKNLHIMKHARVTKIITDGKQAKGVTIDTKSGKIDVFAKEVILSAGVFESPKLLMLSGIGPEEELKRVGVPVLHDLPVGYGLQDQPFVPVTITGPSDITSGVTTGLSTNPGAFPGPVISGSFSSSSGNLDLAHYSFIFGSLTPLFFYIMFVNFNFGLEVTKSLYLTQPEKERMLIFAALGKPKSTGRVTLRSRDPYDPPVIYNGYYTEESDVTRMVEAVKVVLKVKDTSYFVKAGGGFVRPSLPLCDHLEFDSHEYWVCYVRSLSSTLYHTTSSCAMGKVVDERLRVEGVKGLRVVDASAMPTVPATATVMPTIMLAEKAADMIKEDYGMAIS